MAQAFVFSPCARRSRITPKGRHPIRDFAQECVLPDITPYIGSVPVFECLAHRQVLRIQLYRANSTDCDRDRFRLLRLWCNLSVTGPMAMSGSYFYDSPRHPRNYTRAELMKRAWEMDVLECTRCGGRMRILAAIHSPDAIRACLGLPSRAPPISPPLEDHVNGFYLSPRAALTRKGKPGCWGMNHVTRQAPNTPPPGY